MYHQSPISGIASFNSNYIATAGYDNHVILWDARTHRPISLSSHDHLANQVEFSPCGKYLASSSSDHSARIWSIPKLKLNCVLHHGDDVEGIAFNEDSSFIATASRDRMVRVFSNLGELKFSFSGHTNDVLTVAWINDDLIVSCGDDSTLRYWSLSKNACIKVVDMGGMETDTLCVNPEGQIISGNDDGEIVLFNPNGEKLNSIQAHKSGIKRLVMNGQRVISLSYDGTLKTWLVTSSEIVEEHEGIFPNIVWPRSCAFIDESTIAFVTFGDRYALYNLDTCNWSIESIQETHGINAIYSRGNITLTVGDAGIVRKNGNILNQVPSLCNFISEQNGTILCGGQDGAIYDGKTSEIIYQHHSPLNCCASLQFGEQIFFCVGSYTGELILLKYNSKSKTFNHETNITLHDNAIKDLSVTGESLFSVCADHSVKLHKINKDLSITLTLKGRHDKIVNGCASINGEFVSVSRDKYLKIWGDKVTTIPTPHNHSIKCVASDDKSIIASGDYRGTVAIFNSYTELWKSYKISKHGVSAIVYCPINDSFKATLYDGSVQTVPAN